MTGQPDALRIDRWLFFCRFFKSRSRATAAVGGGHVRVNGERPSAGTRVKVGDTIEIVRERLEYKLTITAIPARRGPAAEARGCYEEDAASVAARESKTAALRQDRLSMPVTGGRPDKHTRRKLIRRKNG